MFFASSRSSPSHVGNVRQDALRHCWQQAGTVRRDLEQDEAHGQVGCEKDFVEKNMPVLPIAGWTGESLLKNFDDMPGWKGAVVFVVTTEIHPDTLYDVLDKVCKLPSRPLSAPMRMPIPGIYKIDVKSVKYDSHLTGY